MIPTISQSAKLHEKKKAIVHSVGSIHSMEGNLTPATPTAPGHQARSDSTNEYERRDLESDDESQGTDPQAVPDDEGGISSAIDDEAELKRIKDLPKEVGVMLLTVGVLGFALPGVVGTPAIIAGGLVLWPKAFGKVENWFERKFPQVHKQSLFQIHRYLNDLEGRYPNSTSRGE
jgi:hypothetical protein